MSFRRPDRARKIRAKKSRRFPSFFSPSAALSLDRGRQFRFEPLEQRWLLAIDTVTSNADDGSAGTLRSVIASAASGATIEFAANLPQINLTQGQIEINKSLSIVGPGAGALTIDQTTSNARLFLIDATDAGNNPVTVSMSGLTLTGGDANDFQNLITEGGAIDNQGNASLSAMVLTGNNASGDGGAIANFGVMTMTGTTISGSSAFGGGGIGNFSSGTLTVSDSTIANNTAAVAGGISNGGTLTVTHSTFSGNAGSDVAGAIENFANTTVRDSTFFNNSSGVQGGGIDNSGGSGVILTVTNSTFSGNTAPKGAGITNYSGTAYLANSIVVGNSAGQDPDVYGVYAAADHNLIGVLGDATGFNGNNIVLNSDDVAVAGLGPLANNGGPTQTMALLAGSPAIDAGDNSPPGFPANPSTDQRGFPRIVNGIIDIGAYEVQSTNFQITVGGTYTLEVAPGAPLIKAIELLDSQGNEVEQWPLTTPSITITNTSGQAVQLVVDSTNGAVPMPVTFDGGTGDGSSLVLQGIPPEATVTNHTYSPGPGTGQGTDTAKVNGVTETVSFVNLTPVYDSLPGALTVDGTNGDDAINYAEGNDTTATPNTAWGQVTVNNLEAINFTNQTSLTIDGLAGSDTTNLNNQNTPTGLTTISVNGGDPTASDTLIVNGRVNATDNFTYTPATTTSDTGNVSDTGLPTVDFTGIEHLTINGQNGGPTTAGDDSLTINTSHLSAGQTEILTPGSTFDSGHVDFRDRPGGINPTAVPLDFKALGVAGSLSFTDSGVFDNLIYNGTPLNDTFSVTAGGVVTLNDQIPVNTAPDMISVILAGLGGDDTFNIAGNNNLPGNGGPGIVVEGSDAANNTLNFTGNGSGAVTVDLAAQTVQEAGFAPVSYSNVATVDVNAAGAAVTIADANPDTNLAVTPGGATSATVQANGTGTLVNVTGAKATGIVANLAGGGNTLIVNGPASGQTFTTTNSSVTVDSDLPIGYTANQLSALDLNGGAGDDTFKMNTGVTTPIVINGGLGSNTLDASGAGTFSVYPGASSDAGSLSTPSNNGNNIANISFTGIQTINLTGTGASDNLQVFGTGGNDVFTQEETGVTVNAGPAIGFNPFNSPGSANAGFTQVSLFGGGGKDRYDLNPAAIGDTTTLNVVSDVLASGSTMSVSAAGLHDALTVVPMSAGNGTVTDTAGLTQLGFVTYSGIAGIDLVGQTGDGDTANVDGTEGNDTLTYTPGSDGGSGTVTGTLDTNNQTLNGPFALPTVTFSQMSPTGPVGLFVLANGGNDAAIIDGTSGNDTFAVDAKTGTITLNNVAVTTGGATSLVLNGLTGDNSYKIDASAGNVYKSIAVNGSGLTDPDSLTLVGDGTDAATVTLNADGTADVSGGGLGTVHVSGVVNLTVDNSAGAGASVTVVDNASNNTLDVTPTGANSATEQIAGQPLVVNTVSTGNLNVMLAPNGNDALVVNGSQYNDTMNVSDSLVTDTETSGPAVTLQSVAISGEASLTVNGNDGSDTFNVTPSATVPIFVDGGNPVGVLPGDQFNLVSGGAAVTFTAGPTSDSGGFQVANDATVSFTHIETIGNMGATGVTVNGTNGDDQITIIARDKSYNAAADGVQDFTVSVNNGPNILFINTPTLNVNALSGNDDIVLEAPAPNNAKWNVQVTVDGGPPASSGSGLGDVFALETPAGSNAQNVTYTPTGSNSGTFNDTTLTSLITLTNVEQTFYDGGAANDTLTLGNAGNLFAQFTAGATADSGSLTMQFGYNGPSAMPLSFSNLGFTGGLSVPGGGFGSLDVNGPNVATDFNLLSSGVVQLFKPLGAAPETVPITTTDAAVRFIGHSGNDTFNVPGNQPFGFGLQVEGDAGNNTLNFTGDGNAAIVVDLAAQSVHEIGFGTVSFIGVSTVNVDAHGAAVTVIDSNANTNLAMTPTPTGASIQTTGSALINIVNAVAPLVNPALTVILPGGGNTLTVNGSAGNDAITVTNSLVTIAGDLPIAYTPANLAALDINGLAGNDTLTVDSTNGPVTEPVYFDGGTGSNALILIDNKNTVVSDVYAAGPQPGQGTDTLNFGTVAKPVLETVQFTNLTPVYDSVAGPLTVVGTNGDDAINYIEGNDLSNTPNTAWGQVSVNNQEAINFTAKTSLSIQALAGSDTINLNNPNTPAGLTGTISVDGGDPTGGSDTLIVNSEGRNLVLEPTAQGAGTVTYFGGGLPSSPFTNIEHLDLVGQLHAGNPFGIDGTKGNDHFVYTPGATPDTATITGTMGQNDATGNGPFPLVPVTVSGMNQGNTVVFNAFGQQGGTDDFVFNGTSQSNAISVNNGGVFGGITVGNTVAGQLFSNVNFANMASGVINTGESNDSVTIDGSEPLPLTVNGNPPKSDILNFNGNGGAVSVDLGADTVTDGAGLITFNGIGTVNVNAAGAALTIVDGTANTDLSVTPTGANSGTAQAAGTPVVNFSGVKTTGITVDLANGTQVNVHSPSPGATFVADEPTRTIYVTKADGTKLIPVVLNNDVQIVELDSQIGNNTFLVVPAPAVLGLGKTDVVGQPNFQVPSNLLVNVVGGGSAAQNALVIANYNSITGQASTLDAGLFAVDDRTSNSGGIVRMFHSNGPAPANEPNQYPDISYTNIGTVSPDTVTNGTNQQTLTIGPDMYDPNSSRNNAAYLGSGATINATNLAIFPNAFEHQFLQAEQDWFRVVAQSTGTMDFQVYFNQYAGFLPGNGQLQIQVYDSSGNEITHFGVNDQTSDERRRIPVVAGETYYLQVYGVSQDPTKFPQNAAAPDVFDPNNATVNGYSITIVNTPAPTPNAIGLNDVVAQGLVSNTIAPTTTTFTANSAPTPPPVIPPNFQTQPLPPLSTLDGFYVGMYLEFTSGPLVGQRQLISGYTAATRTFTFASAFSQAPDVTDSFQIESNDTGRSQLDNITRDNTPTIYIRFDAANTPGDGLLDLQGGGNTSQTPPNNVPILVPFWAGNAATAPYSPANNGSYRIAVYDETNPQSPIFLGYANAVSGQNGVFQLQVTTPLADGSHNLVAKVELDSPSTPSNHDVGAGVSLSIVVDTQAPPVYFGSPTVPNSGLQGASDTGVAGQPATINDRITANSTPTFYGVAEANAVVKLYVDMNGDGKVDNGDIFIGQATATPIDGTNQDPNGQWTITSSIDLNNPAFGFAHDGLRTILATAEDVAGNVSAAQILQIFLDTQGPQVGNVTVTGNPNYNLFLNKPDQPTPTPLVNALDVTFTDQPVRVGPDFVYPAVNPVLATTIADYELVGKNNGPIPITSITLADSTAAGSPGKTVVTLHFAAPLADDQYTLSISDKIEDNAGNPIDGEFNGVSFPSGNNSPGGSFAGTFVVNSHPHLAVYSGGSVALDINGNGKFDPSNSVTNSDLVETFGYASDRLFDGNFANTNGFVSGFDELGAYGFVNNQWRWLLNFDPAAGTSNPTTFIEPFPIDGAPVAGYFAGNPALGMQVGLFDGTTWYLDVLNHHTIDAADIAAGGQLSGDMRGYPIVGDFDGDGKVDLATYQDGVFEFDLSSKDPGGKLTGNYNATINVQSLIPNNIGFSGVLAQPVAADIDGDGITDLGLYVPGQTTNVPYGQAAWYWLVSNDAKDAGGVNPAGAFASLNHPFNPTPLGHDLFYQFGNQFAVPLVGIWDPPSSTADTTTTPPTNTATDPTSGWVTGLYETVLGRTPSSDEVANWGKIIGTGQVTSQQVSQDFLESPERLATIIDGLYQQYLGRAPDTAGVNYWIGVWQAGGGEEQVQAGIIGSAEYYATAGKLHPDLSPDAAWVTALYNSILGRAPDSQGLEFWVNGLKYQTRASIVLGFVTSNEYRLTLINGWFEEYLGRALDPSGAQYWVQQMQLGLTQDALQAGILGSAEFKAKFSGS
jgi:hypothetical protein